MRLSLILIFAAICIFNSFSYSQIDENRIHGTVVAETGEPMNGVSVLLFDANNHMSVQNGKINPNYYQESVLTNTDDDGNWEFHDPGIAYGLYFTDEEGYALIQTGKYNNGSTTTLTPWSTIHGKLTVLAGGNANESINMHVINNAFGGGNSNFYFQYNTKTKEDGTFTFEHVIEKEFQVNHSVPENLNQTSGTSYYVSSTRVTTKPGDEFHVSLYSTTSAHPYKINSTALIFVAGILIMAGLIFIMRRYAMMSVD